MPDAAANLAEKFPFATQPLARRCCFAQAAFSPGAAAGTAQTHTLRKRVLAGRRRQTIADAAFEQLFKSPAQPPFLAAIPRGAAALPAEKGRRVTQRNRFFCASISSGAADHPAQQPLTAVLPPSVPANLGNPPALLRKPLKKKLVLI